MFGLLDLGQYGYASSMQREKTSIEMDSTKMRNDDSLHRFESFR